MGKPSCLLCLLVIALCIVRTSGARAGTGGPKTAYITTGDWQWLTGYPMDSPATIRAGLASLRDTFGCDRIWWRGIQDDLTLRTFVLRPEIRLWHGWWMWLKHLNDEVGLNRAAVKAGHDLGMEVWAYTALFDWGAQGEAGFTPELPYPCEYRLRARRPEYAPVNRHGTRIQGGPVEFCYPAARRAVVRDLVGMAQRSGCDGVTLYTYAENYGLRYFDEFGYNRPIVDEFRRRHGVDIRTQPFDREAWAQLRGEYVTQFLRELHGALRRRGKKLAVALDPSDSHLPIVWGKGQALPEGYQHAGWQFRPAGHIHLDWERWVREGVVDELSVGPPSGAESDALAVELAGACRGTKVGVSQFRSKGSIPSPNVARVVFPGGDEAMCGFDWECNVQWGETEKLAQQPADALRSRDVYARRRALYMISRGKQTSPAAEVVAATRDEDVFARILAARALAALRDPAGVPAMEKLLLDPENSVRMEAALALADHPGPESAMRIAEALFRPECTWQYRYVAAPTALRKLQDARKLSPAVVDAFLARLSDAKAEHRRVALHQLAYLGCAQPAVTAAALSVLAGDPDACAREFAAKVARQAGPTPAVVEALLGALGSPPESVQIRAARALAEMLGRSDASSRPRALEAVAALFGRFGGRSRRPDRDWAWRDVGGSLLLFGADGEAALRAAMAQRGDRRLAERAWQVLYIRQNNERFVPATEEEDAAAHAARPGSR